MRRGKNSAPQLVAIGSDPVAGTLELAKQFWKHADRAVLAGADDPEGTLQGAALAAERAAPLLIRPRGEGKAALAHALSSLGIRHVTLVLGSATTAPAWAAEHPAWLEVSNAANAQRRLVEGWGRARRPQRHRRPLARRQGAQRRHGLAGPVPGPGASRPVVYCHSASAAAAETDVWQLIRRYGLQPRTVTILADYGSLGQNLVDVEGDQRRR